MPVYENGRLTIRVNYKPARCGYKTVDYSSLLEAFELNHAIELSRQIEQTYGGKETASHASSSAAIMRFWILQWKACPEQFTFTPASAREHLQVIKNLRAAWYQQFKPGQDNEAALGTLNNNWANFILLLKNLADAGAMPRIDYSIAGANSRFSSNAFKQSSKLLVDHQTAGQVIKSIDVDGDSYTDKLLEPVSLALSNDQYLTEYQARLQHAYDAFLQCAVEEMMRYRKLAEEGQMLLQQVNYAAIQSHMNSVSFKRKYIDPVTGKNFFEADHPQQVANLLAMIKHEMGGIPKAYKTKIKVNGAMKTVLVGEQRWSYVQAYGKHRLVPYLGLLTQESLVPLLVILLLENPRINVESLIMAELEDRYGQQVLLSSAGEGDDIRLTVNKLRAGAQKSVILTGYSKLAMECLLEWTSPYRETLREQGNPNASRLLLVLDDYTIVPALPNIVLNHFNGSTRGKGVRSYRNESFINRHTELAPWKDRATLAALRVSSGVLEWLRSGGDFELTRQVFGHKDAKTTINNYIPRQLQAVMHERMIRRFQNLLICAACAGKSYMLAATDFGTLEELHTFLLGMLDSTDGHQGNPLMDRIRKALGMNSPSADEPMLSANESELAGNREVIWKLTPDGLAMLRLYREQLLALNLSQDEMNRADATGTSMQFWLDLGNVVAAFDEVGLPDQYLEFETVFRESVERAEVLRGKISLPIEGLRGDVNEIE